MRVGSGGFVFWWRRKNEGTMDITSIDNCYEEDGLINLQSALAGLNRENPLDPTRRVLVAILPEYSSTGRIDRLNVCTVSASDPGTLEPEEMALMAAAAGIIARLQRHRAEAIAKLEAER